MTGTHVDFINPPADVTAALTALQHACAGWAPTEVANQATSTPPIPPPPATTEAHVCHYIADPSGVEIANLEVGAGLTAALLIAAWLILARHPYLVALIKAVAGRFRRRVAER